MTTELRELMASAADDQPPHDLAGRAMAGARRRRQGRLAVLGSVAAVTALVAGAVVLGPLQQRGDEPRPQDIASEGVAPLPSEMPIPDENMPTLTAGAIRAASAAYVWDSRLMLVDAATADVVAWNGFPQLEGIDISSDKVNALLPYQVRLSPDGRTALVALRFETSQRLLGIRLALLDVPTAEVTRITGLKLSDEYAESTWLEYNLVAWTPSSQAVYCVCIGSRLTDPDLGIWSIEPDVEPGNGFGVRRVSDVVPTQISAGAAGMAVQLEPGGTWALMTGDGSVSTPLAAGDAFALSSDGSNLFAVTRDGTYGIRTVDESGERMASSPLPAGPVSSLQALGNGFVLVSRSESAPPGEPVPPSQLLAHLLNRDTAPQLLTTFPAGTTSPSFATGVDLAP